MRTNTNYVNQYANHSLRGVALTPLQQASEMTPDNTPFQRKSKLNNEVYQLVYRLNTNSKSPATNHMLFQENDIVARLNYYKATQSNTDDNSPYNIYPKT